MQKKIGLLIFKVTVTARAHVQSKSYLLNYSARSRANKNDHTLSVKVLLRVSLRTHGKGMGRDGIFCRARRETLFILGIMSTISDDKGSFCLFVC